MESTQEWTKQIKQLSFMGLNSEECRSLEVLIPVYLSVGTRFVLTPYSLQLCSPNFWYMLVLYFWKCCFCANWWFNGSFGKGCILSGSSSVSESTYFFSFLRGCSFVVKPSSLVHKTSKILGFLNKQLGSRMNVAKKDMIESLIYNARMNSHTTYKTQMSENEFLWVINGALY